MPLDEMGKSLNAAFRRGRARYRALLETSGPNLAPEVMGKAIGASTQTVYDRIKRGKLVAVSVADEWKLPAWQVRDRRLIPGFERTLTALGERSQVARFLFFEIPNIFLNEQSPRTALLTGEYEFVIRVVKADGEQMAR
jgi:hypothetical protein